MIIFKDEDLNENWNLIELNDLLESQKAGCWGKESDEIEGTPVLRSTNYTKNFKLKLDDIAFREISKKDIENKKLEYMDILLEKSGGGPSQPVGRVILFDLVEDRNYVCGNFIQLLRPNKSIICPKYLYYWLVLIHKKGFTNLLQNQTTGIRNLRLKDYLKLQVPVPPLKTQQKIVEILEKAEKLKEWRAEADVLTDEYLKSLFINLFGHPLSKDNLYSKIMLKELIKIIVPTRDKPKSFTGTIPWVTLPDLSDSIYIGESKYKLSKEEAKPTKTRLFPKNTVLLSCAGSLGKVAIADKELYTNQQFYGLVCDQSKILPEFLAYQLLFFGEDYYKNIGGTSTLTFFRKEIALKIKVILPPLELQNQFAQTVQKVEQIKAHQKQSKQQIDNLFNTLMQKAFKGELTC